MQVLEEVEAAVGRHHRIDDVVDLAVAVEIRQQLDLDTVDTGLAVVQDAVAIGVEPHLVADRSRLRILDTRVVVRGGLADLHDDRAGLAGGRIDVAVVDVVTDIAVHEGLARRIRGEDDRVGAGVQPGEGIGAVGQGEGGGHHNARRVEKLHFGAHDRRLAVVAVVVVLVAEIAPGDRRGARILDPGIDVALVLAGGEADRAGVAVATGADGLDIAVDGVVKPDVRVDEDLALGPCHVVRILEADDVVALFQAGEQVVAVGIRGGIGDDARADLDQPDRRVRDPRLAVVDAVVVLVAEVAPAERTQRLVADAEVDVGIAVLRDGHDARGAAAVDVAVAAVVRARILDRELGAVRRHAHDLVVADRDVIELVVAVGVGLGLGHDVAVEVEQLDDHARLGRLVRHDRLRRADEVDLVDPDELAIVAVHDQLEFVAGVQLHVLDDVGREAAVVAAAAVAVTVELDRLDQLAVDLDPDRRLAVVLVLHPDLDVVGAVLALEVGLQVAVPVGIAGGLELHQLAARGMAAIDAGEAAHDHVLGLDRVGLAGDHGDFTVDAVAVDVAEHGARDAAGLDLLARRQILVGRVPPAIDHVAAGMNRQLRSRRRHAVGGQEGEIVAPGAFLLDLDHHVPVAVLVVHPVVDLGVDLAAVAQRAVLALDRGLLAVLVVRVLVAVAVAAQVAVVVIDREAGRGRGGHDERVAATDVGIASAQEVGLGEGRELKTLVGHQSLPQERAA